MKNFDLNLIGKIIVIIGLIMIISILTYGAFTIHPLFGLSIVGFILILIGIAIVNLSQS